MAKKSENKPKVGDLVTVKVIRAHDGLKEGEVMKHKWTASIAYMVENKYWEIVNND